MRPIKFRAWHKVAKEMLQAGDSNGTTHPCDPVVYYMQGQPVELMQFTGLLDKTGREIYEGDAIKIPSGYSGDCWNKAKIREVEWIAADFEHDIGFYLSAPDGCLWSDCEVIGNIYENPELLGGKDA